MWLSVCKNVIMSNNKKNWVDPDPAIRIGSSKSGKAIGRANTVHILGHDGKVCATIYSSKDGKAILKCGAKVAIETHNMVLKVD